ncbi:MAG: signal peptide peptidase SppA, partial [Opitutales bacterium]
LGLLVGWFILSSFQKGEAEVEEGAFLVIDLSMNLTDRPDESDPSNLIAELAGGSLSKQRHLLEVLDAIRKAAADERIRGIFLHGSFITDGYGSGYAALAELNQELARFRKAGKPIVAHADHPTIRDFYVLSGADELLMHPYGDLLLHGFAAEGMFYGNAFEKYGVNVQLVRTGKYKGAAEDLISDRFSEENKEQIQVLLDQRWAHVLDTIANHRGIQPMRLRTLLDEQFHFSPEEAAVHGLVDRTAYLDEAIDRLVDLGSPDEETGSFVQISLGDYLDEDDAEESEEEEGGVAIVYVEGAISEVRVNPNDAGADEIARDLRLIRTKAKAKAVVLRVNSPGGGVTASETIQREVDRVRGAGIPVVVSMGSVAASGGYWISSHSDRIFAQRETITGSIGVFGLSMDFKELAESVGITRDVVKTSPHADVLSFLRPKTEEELALVQGIVDDFYDRFLKKVATGRSLTKEQVAAIAQGRVWSGRDARQNGLIDEFGGLYAAIDYAAKLAKLPAGYSVTEYPRKRKGMELLREMLGLPVKLESKDRPLFTNFLERVKKELGAWARLDDPRGAYALLPWHLHLP